MATILDQVKLYCEENQGKERAVIIAGIQYQFKLAYTTAVTYYHKWKKEFMHTEKCVPTEEIRVEPEIKEPRKKKEHFVIKENNSDDEIDKKLEEMIVDEEPKAALVDKEEVKEFVADAMEPPKEFTFNISPEKIEEVLKELGEEGKFLYEEPQEDMIYQPVHYTSGKLQTIDILESVLTEEELQGYIMGNVLKYCSRWKLKGGIEDLKKARNYLNRLITGEWFKE